MSSEQIKITVEHEPGCTMLVIFGLLLGALIGGNMGGCTINIGSEVTRPKERGSMLKEIREQHESGNCPDE